MRTLAVLVCLVICVSACSTPARRARADRPVYTLAQSQGRFVTPARAGLAGYTAQGPDGQQMSHTTLVTGSLSRSPDDVHSIDVSLVATTTAQVARTTQPTTISAATFVPGGMSPTSRSVVEARS